jgi:GST-like protein
LRRAPRDLIVSAPAPGHWGASHRDFRHGKAEDCPMIDLYFWPTGNGKKIVILLEEAGIPYRIKPVNIGRGDQFDAGYLKIAPNNRMPAIVDDDPMGGGAPLSIFESGAIMMYLAEKVGKFWPQAPHAKYEVAQWCYWQTGNQGPKLGEQGHFARAAQNPENGDQAYAMRRFGNEAHRLYGVMNLGLHGKRYLAAGAYTIADMICYPWSVNWKMRGLDIEEFPNVKRWLEEIGERPAVQKAMALGPEFREDPATISDEEKARRAGILANQRAWPVPKEWVAAE